MIEKFITYMRNQNWTVEVNEKQEFCLPKPMKNRYTGYPESWMNFISTVKSMVREDERAWFLCAEDYDIQGDKAWQWNEWELLSLKTAENDTAWENEIREFWDGHLPIFLSLEDGYAYYGISLKECSRFLFRGRTLFIGLRKKSWRRSRPDLKSSRLDFMAGSKWI